MATATFPTSSGTELHAARIASTSLLDFNSPGDCRVYKRRWLMLTLYSLCAVADAMHWLQYVIITETIQKYYDISVYVIDFTAISYSLTFIIFVLPAIHLIERFGLKTMLICGDIMIISASGLKFASLNPKYFYVGFTGQVLAGMAQVFIVNVPSYLAGLWFPKNEVSTACAVGVLGTAIGITLSFYIPPQLISIGGKLAFHGRKGTRTGLLYVYIYQSILPVVLLPLLILVFQSHPPKPPSYARLAKDTENVTGWTAVKKLFFNLNYILVLVSYSMNVSVYYCVSTLLGQIITRAELAGTAGATIVLFGIAGYFFFGWLMDKTHCFKLISLITYGMAMVGLAIFWVNATLELHDSVYIISASIMGVFLASYVVISIEFASELTYPISETVSTSILLAFGEAFSIVLIYSSAALLEHTGKYSVIYTTFAFMFIGLVPTTLIRNIHLKRLSVRPTDRILGKSSSCWKSGQWPVLRPIFYAQAQKQLNKSHLHIESVGYVKIQTLPSKKCHSKMDKLIWRCMYENC